MKNQSTLINVFGDLIGGFHDGLMITAKQEVIYHNKEFNSIFEVIDESSPEKLEGMSSPTNNTLMTEQNVVESNIIRRMKRALTCGT